MNKFEVVLKGNSVRLIEYQVLYDQDGNPVKTSKHSKAIGIGDFKGDKAKYKAKVKGFLETAYGNNLAELVSENVALIGSEDYLKEELKKEQARGIQLQEQLALTLGRIDVLEQEATVRSTALADASERILDLEADMATERTAMQTEISVLKEELTDAANEMRMYESALDALEAVEPIPEPVAGPVEATDSK